MERKRNRVIRSSIINIWSDGVSKRRNMQARHTWTNAIASVIQICMTWQVMRWEFYKIANSCFANWQTSLSCEFWSREPRQRAEYVFKSLPVYFSIKRHAPLQRGHRLNLENAFAKAYLVYVFPIQFAPMALFFLRLCLARRFVPLRRKNAITRRRRCSSSRTGRILPCPCKTRENVSRSLCGRRTRFNVMHVIFQARKWYRAFLSQKSWVNITIPSQSALIVSN